MHFEVFVHGYWGHSQGSARRYLLLSPWRVGRLQMAHSNLSKAQTHSFPSRVKNILPPPPSSFHPPAPRQPFTTLHFLYVLHTKAARLVLETVHSAP